MEHYSVFNDLALLIDVTPLSWGALMACLLSGGIIGLERQLIGKPVGIRTSVLVCLGTYVFVVIGIELSTGNADPSRVVGQIITGIGFLGAGVMMTRDGAVVGATSAASIWMLAAIGVVIAVESPLLGIRLAVLSVILLVGVNYIENRIHEFRKRAYEKKSAALNGAEGELPPRPE